MNKNFYVILFLLTFCLMGCNNDENNLTYTQSELETFLIRDCKEAIYVFNDENLIYNFDFEKTSEGNIGKYHRHQLSGKEYKDCNFIWEIEPNGDEGIVTLAFEENKGRIRKRMKLTEQTYTNITIGADGEQEIYHGSEILWKLEFNPKDDPFFNK